MIYGNTIRSETNGFPKNAMPGYGRHELVSFAVLGKAYFTLGYNNALTSSLLDIWEFDPAGAVGGLWTLKNSFIGDARYGAAVLGFRALLRDVGARQTHL